MITLKKLLLLLLFTVTVTACKDNSLRLGVATTLEDSGLLALLITHFKQEHDIKVKTIVTGSGHLFSLIQQGDIDIAITHDPIGEKKLMAEGFINQRIPLFHNHFLIVGNQSNPANIHSGLLIEDVFYKIHTEKHVFISRADNSGTHRMEQRLWQQVKEKYSNFTSTPTSSPYIIETGTGMGSTLSVAINKAAYTLVDLGTWLHFNDKQNHQILWKNTNKLLNP